MKFSTLDLTVNNVVLTYSPYDRGANGAFVYRESGSLVHNTRIIASAMVNDKASDKYTLQVNTPRLACPDSCGLAVEVGTDIAKVDFRFRADTTSEQRLLQIDKLAALISEFRSTIGARETIYS